jgi:hypothetical protein
MLSVFRLASLAIGAFAVVKTVQFMHAAADVVASAAELTRGFHS